MSSELVKTRSKIISTSNPSRSHSSLVLSRERTDHTTDGQRGQGGNASRCSGGKDEPPRPATCSILGVSSCVSASRRIWVPPSSVNRDAQYPRHPTQDKFNVIFRKIRGILNKITPEKFNKLKSELLNVGLDSSDLLKGLILLIFEKALEEPKYSSMYAQLCRVLSEEAPNFDNSSTNTNSAPNNNSTFCRLLLAKCKDEFENRRKAIEAFENKDGPLTSSEEEQRSIAKHKMLGNIKFICELGKQELLQETILHDCIYQLLQNNKKAGSGDQDKTLLQDKAEDLECLCQIMKTIGRLLDTPKARPRMNQYFDRMERYSNNFELPCRIRFMLQDVHELRKNKWLPRRGHEHGPTTIHQIREEAARDFGVYVPMAGNANRYAFPGENQLHGKRLEDVLAAFSPFNTFNLGTGPGAINENLITGNHRGSHGGMHMNMNANMHMNQHMNMQHQHMQNHHMSQANTNALNMALHYGNQNQNKRDQRGGGGGPNNMIPNANNNQMSGNTAPNKLPPRFQRQQMHQQNQHIQQMPQQQQQQAIIMSSQQNAQMMSNNNANNVNKLVSSLAHPSSMDAGISLRPAQNSMVLKPNIAIKSQQMNDSNMKAFDGPNKLNINNETSSDSKPNHTNKDVVMKNSEEALNEYISENQNMDEVVVKFKQLKIPKNFQVDVVVNMIKKSLDKIESERDSVSKLLVQLKAEDVISSNIFMNAFTAIINQIDDLEPDVPRVKSHLAGFISRAISDDLISLKEASEPLDGGQFYPLFLLCLQHLHKSKGQGWLVDAFTESKINLISMLPENDRNKERLADILEDRALGFLYPMLRIESELGKLVLSSECTPATLYRWIKDNVDTSLQANSEFIQVLFTSVLKFITIESPKSNLNEKEDPSQQTNGPNVDREKIALTKFTQVLQAFLQDNCALQLMALYSLQSFCHSIGFPKGMLLRWFVMLYDLEIIEEEVFIKWKEDINDEFPGKGKALFQVNKWLTWLEEAEEEEEEDDEDEDDVETQTATGIEKIETGIGLEVDAV